MSETTTEDSNEAPGDFRLLVQKLGMQAFYALGILDIPGAPKVEKPNLPVARAVIDDLMLLRVKTAGNLTSGERLTLEKFISDLQLQYLRRAEDAGDASSGPDPAAEQASS